MDSNGNPYMSRNNGHDYEVAQSVDPGIMFHRGGPTMDGLQEDPIHSLSKYWADDSMPDPVIGVEQLSFYGNEASQSPSDVSAHFLESGFRPSVGPANHGHRQNRHEQTRHQRSRNTSGGPFSPNEQDIFMIPSNPFFSVRNDMQNQTFRTPESSPLGPSTSQSSQIALDSSLMHQYHDGGSFDPSAGNCR